MSSSTNLGEVFTGGATTSQHVEAENDDHFQNTTFKLKRTRSLGLLDDFIVPSKEESDKEGSEKGGKTEDSLATGGSEGVMKENENRGPKHNLKENEITREISDASNTPSPAHIQSPDIIPLDDTDVHDEPSLHVDYLSHQWDVSDISRSWRYVTNKRKDVANASRLENASWRTWAQRRGNLKTISPKEVNWSKDNDVTWLYGPILKEENHGDNDECYDQSHSRVGTSAAAGDISLPDKQQKRLKPILKRRTVEDQMISHANLYKLQLATNRVNERNQKMLEQKKAQISAPLLDPPEFYDYDAISAKLNTQYQNLDLHNSPSINNSSMASPEAESDTNNQATDGNADGESTISHGSNEERHIHFNDEVQQCIAVDNYSDEDSTSDSRGEFYDFDDDYVYEDFHGSRSPSISQEEDGYDEEYEEDNDEDEEDEDEGGFFLNVRTPSPAAQNYPGIASSSKDKSSLAKSEYDSGNISPLSSGSVKTFKTIHLLPSTTLNHGSSDEESDSDKIYSSTLSHNAGNRGYDFYYDYNSVYTCDPNNAIYRNSTDDSDQFDVVDVPENITLGSNFDYHEIENNNLDVNSPVVSGASDATRKTKNHEKDSSNNEEKVPQDSLTASVASEKDSMHGFSLDPDANSSASPNFNGNSDTDSDVDSDSESNSDEGLSISAKNSSHSLAQLVFSGMTSTSTRDDITPHYPFQDPKPVEKHVSELNSRYSSSSLSKQPPSTNSLSLLFFGGDAKLTSTSETKSLAAAFFGSNGDSSQEDEIKDSTQHKDDTQLQKSFGAAKSKTPPLPPQTTSATAFLSELSSHSHNSNQTKASAFSFDSDSDSEAESVPLARPSIIPNDTRSYASLSQVADRNGIRTPSPDVPASENAHGVHNSAESGSSGTSSHPKNLVGQAKGFANHLLGNWKGNDTSN